MVLKRTFLFASLLLISIFGTSCSSGYVIQKSNRALLGINSATVADQKVAEMIAPYKASLDAEMNRVVGHAAHALVKRSPLMESTLSNFFADACFQQAKMIEKDIDFAMPSTMGGMRIDLPAGDIKMSNIFELMPFENELIVVELKGEDVLELVKFIVSSGGQPIANIEIEYKSKIPTEIEINGEDFDRNKTYKLLTSDFILGGGDHVKGVSNVLSRKVLNLKVRDAVLKFVEQETNAGRSLKAELDGRIKED